MNTWHSRLTVARDQRGQRKTDLADAVGVSNATVSDWESGETKKIEGENLIKVCDFLNISASWLLFGKGEMEHLSLTDDDRRAIQINRGIIDAKSRVAWYRAGDSFVEPIETIKPKNNGTQ